MLAQTHYTYRYANSKHTRSLPPVPSASRSSTSSSTTAAPSRRTHVANYSPLGALLSRNQIPEAVRFLEDSLERKNRVHALAVGDLLEGEVGKRSVVLAQQNNMHCIYNTQEVWCHSLHVLPHVSIIHPSSAPPAMPMVYRWSATSMLGPSLCGHSCAVCMLLVCSLMPAGQA